MRSTEPRRRNPRRRRAGDRPVREPALRGGRSRTIDAALARDDLDRTTRGQLSGMQALLSEALGRPDVGLQQVDVAIAHQPDDFVLHEVRALNLVGLGRSQDAVKSARRALAVAPRNPELLETTGVAERFAGQPDVALPRLLAAAVDRPDLPRARAELSACFTQLGRFDEARGALESLSAAGRRDPFALYADACLLGATGERGDAVERLADAVRIRPGLGRRATADPVLAWMREDVSAGAQPVGPDDPGRERTHSDQPHGRGSDDLAAG